MRKILFIIAFLVGLFTYGQGEGEITIKAFDSDKQKVTTYEMSGPNLIFQIENDILKQVDIVAGLDAYFGGTDWRTGGGGSTTTDAADLTTGVLDDARVQESNVTQHEAALSITESQISDLNHTVDTDNQTLSEVLSESADAGGTTITNIGAPSLANDAVRKTDLDAQSISTDGIDKTDDYTISDAEIGQIHNIIVNAPDSIVVTYPNDLTVFGWTKFVVRGTGHVAIDLDAMTTTGGSFKTIPGRGQTITVRNYSATEADVLDPDRHMAYVHVAPITEYYTTANALATGANEANSNTGTTSGGAGTSVTVNSSDFTEGAYSLECVTLGDSGRREVTWSGLTIGVTYLVSVDVKMSAISGTALIQSPTNATMSPTSVAFINPGNWETYTFQMTPTGTTGVIRFYGGVTGQNMKIDNLSITEYIP